MHSLPTIIDADDDDDGDDVNGVSIPFPCISKAKEARSDGPGGYYVCLGTFTCRYESDHRMDGTASGTNKW